jgi:hypothetical protein
MKYSYIVLYKLRIYDVGWMKANLWRLSRFKNDTKMTQKNTKTKKKTQEKQKRETLKQKWDNKCTKMKTKSINK